MSAIDQSVKQRAGIRIGRLLLVVGALVLAACASLTPEEKKLALDTPAVWPATASLEPGTTDERWWTMFGDATLDRLVDEAIANNRDVMIAVARIDEARALAAQARTDQYPSVSGGAGASRGRSSERTDFPTPPGVPAVRDTKRIGIDVAYEVDLWGRYRDTARAARDDLAGTEFAQAVVRIAVVSAATQTYFNLRALDAQVEYARKTLDTRNEAVKLRKRRFEGGVGSELEVHQAEAEAAATLATLAELEEQMQRTESALVVLLGRSPRAMFESEIPRGAPIDALAQPPVLPAGLPATLLAQRPDLREAEARLAAATARIGVARASYLPRFSLTGSYGGESADLADLLISPARVWQLAAALAAPIFTAGRAQATVDVAIARERQAFVQYEKAALGAFREVREAIVSRAGAAQRLDAQRQRITSLQHARRIAQLRHDNGYSAYLEVLDAERSLLQAELNRVAAKRDALLATVDLMRALGGGWRP